ncbi:hypothetical protein DERP_003645 [Dermatophagoides pteronyssinus]|uniref:Uncharacterized protein n=1 Tax=Dermatophagoides pteronyssinus TaxID=6956 RepID=A0ABQ8JL72_DERPT|nr:hypothetical protein DERP_003645 [Dermatophagoides pteronyssinus]
MWSNFNDSFTAITDHISTQIRQTIPTIQSSFGEQHDDDENIKQQREFETKIELLRNEVIRHRNIAQTYKERWLEAENVCKQTTDSAVQQINRLQNELKKLQTDGEHWRKLAKQKSSIEEAQISELEYLRNELKINQQKCNDYEEKFKNFNENFQKIEQEYSKELQQLDQLHDEERKKIIKIT